MVNEGIICFTLLTHRAVACKEEVCCLVIKMLHAVVDHDVGPPQPLGAHVHAGDVLIVRGRPPYIL